MDDSLAMLRRARDEGVTDMVATPHSNHEYVFDPEAVKRALEEVRSACGPAPRLHYGCELHLTPENVEKAVRRPELYSIAHHGYVLVEFSDHSIPVSAGQVLGQMLGAGMVPIVAHPERNPLLRARRHGLEDWIEQGCLVQVTGQSLLGHFGKSASSAAMEWIKRGWVHLVASDAHDLEHRPAGLRDAWKQVEASFGEQTAQRLFVRNPQCVLEGEPLPLREGTAGSRKWFALW